MNIPVFTSNQPRHLALIRSLAAIGDTVFAIQECTTVLPGILKDGSSGSSDIMRAYFAKMLAAEGRIFGALEMSAPNVRTMSLQMGDVSSLPLSTLREALNADVIVVFGASWIKGQLIDALIERKALNIHMGISPYYRGSACNFWALYDGNPDLVGATIHLLSKGLDSGDMLFHALPPREACEPFDLGMYAVAAAHQKLAEAIAHNRILDAKPIPQDKSLEIRYTRNSDFTDAIAAEYLARSLDADTIGKLLASAPERHAILR
ncbi:MAG: methionyl-tRNA formyltransferase [Rhodopseudomonas sp.]|nr:methionyl-tRNA formyltransferase [Rhodopseudomonas sp.]